MIDLNFLKIFFGNSFAIINVVGESLIIPSIYPFLANEEMRKKMCSTIILVGGGCKFLGAEKWLQMRLLANSIPTQHSKSENMVFQVHASSSNKDPATVTWKGAAVMSGLESATELFINKTDWDKQGVKILRERAPFAW